MISAFGPEPDIKKPDGIRVIFRSYQSREKTVQRFRLAGVILGLLVCIYATAGEAELAAAFQQGNWTAVKDETERLANAGNAYGLYIKAAFIGGIYCQDASGPCKPVSGFELNRNEAGRYLIAAAEKGYVTAFDYVAFGYQRGLWGLPVNKEAAIEWSLKGVHLMDGRSASRYYSLTGLKPGGPLPGAHFGSRQ